MASPLWLGLNCLTCVLVSASLWWMDGCQRDSVTHSPSCVLLCLDVYYLFLHSSPSSTLTRSFCGFSHLTVPVFLCLSGFFLCVCFWVSPCALPFSSHLCVSLSSLSSPRLCSRLSARATCGRWWEEKSRVRREKSTLTKAPSPELACSCKKKIHQLPPWLNDVSTTLRMLPLLRWMAQLGST